MDAEPTVTYRVVWELDIHDVAHAEKIAREAVPDRHPCIEERRIISAHKVNNRGATHG